MSLKTQIYSNLEYLEPTSMDSDDSSQSPLELLAQTCSNIGNDHLRSSSISSRKTLSLKKSSSSNQLNSDKILSSKKSSSFSESNYVYTNPELTLSFEQPNLSSSFIEPNIFTNISSRYFHSSLPYFISPNFYFNHCTNSRCFQCETYRNLISTSMNERYSSINEFIDHDRSNNYHCHRSNKLSHTMNRFHPYLKSTNVIHSSNQLPFFYPHLSLSSMSKATRRLNNNPENNN